MKRLLLFLLLCAPCWAANDPTGDPNCVAWYRFESGALTTDSGGTNTLTDHGTVAADAVTYKEGAASANFVATSSQYFSITDASLTAKFPLKNGDTNKKISVCFWWYPDIAPGANSYDILFAKGGDTTKQSLQIRWGNYTNLGIVLASYYASSYNTVNWVHSDVALGNWYHVGVTYDDSDQTYRIRIWDDTNSRLLNNTEVTGNFGGSITVSDGNATIGVDHDATSFRFYDGRLDDVIIFNDILSADEIDQIRGGTFSPSSAAIIYPKQHPIGRGSNQGIGAGL